MISGVPMEVMGLMLGEFVDDYTVRAIDVFAMPQSGTGVSVEAVDPVFQAKMLEITSEFQYFVGVHLPNLRNYYVLGEFHRCQATKP